jgi:hypothetical protein
MNDGPIEEATRSRPKSARLSSQGKARLLGSRQLTKKLILGVAAGGIGCRVLPTGSGSHDLSPGDAVDEAGMGGGRRSTR